MKKSLRPLGLFLYLALCYAAAYALLYISFDTHKIAIITLVIATAAIFVAIVVNTFFHELGHLIFGLLTGYRFLSFRIFSFMLIRENGVLNFKKRAMPGTLGQCLMAPPSYQGGNYPFMLYNLGGILFGGIISLVLVIVSLTVPMHMTLQFFCLMAGWIGLVLNFVNAIPQSGKKAMNDGTNTYYAKKSPAAKAALWNQLQYVALHAKGFRSKEMPDTLFSVPLTEELNNPLTVWQGLAAVERATDLHEFDRAKEIASHLFNNALVEIPLYRAALVSEMLYLELITDCDPDRVDDLYHMMKLFAPILKKSISTHRVLYAYHLLRRNDERLANAAASAFYDAIGRHPFRTDIEFEGDLINYAKECYHLRENQRFHKPIPTATPGVPKIIIEETTEEEENYEGDIMT